MQDLPIQSLLPELCSRLSDSRVTVLSAPTGSGKSTVLPLQLLSQPWLAAQRILMLEPRRLAARACAARMAELLGEEVGATVGYRVRFERQISDATRIEVVTEGILTRRLQNDPELTGVGLVIFDEFHERSIHADLGLALCLDLQGGLREDLRLLVMSATLDTAGLSELLDGAPVVTGEGRSHPVALRYLEREPPTNRIVETAVSGVLRALREVEGDLLVFLPGSGEIRRVTELLQARPECSTVALAPLYGDLGREQQQAALLPRTDGRRRVVLATSIAETSLTIEGITTVVDSGWTRRPRFDPNSGLTRLETVRVSRAAADQRAGRAGRLGPGVCYRLWREATHTTLQEQLPPEIAEADLAPLALELAQWGVANPSDLRWLTPPPPGAYAQARELLLALDALDARGRITPVGARMVQLGLHPRLAHMLVQAPAGSARDQAADLAALLSERDLIPRGRGERPSVDLEERLRLLDRYRRDGAEGARAAGADPAVCRRVLQAGDRWRRQAGSGNGGGEQVVAAGVLLAAAYPDRIAQLRDGEHGRYLLSSGRGANLPEGDRLSGSEYLVAAQLDAGKSEGRIFLAVEIELEPLREVLTGHLVHTSEIRWEPRSERVEAFEEERLGALVLQRRRIRQPDPEAVRAAMLEGVRQMGLEALPWSEAAREWQARVESLRHWQRSAGWPDLSDGALVATLEDWLAPWLDGITRRQQLERLDLAGILRQRLEWRQQQQVEELAPSHIQVPSGSRKRLRYQPGEPPVLAVRLQEMFGLSETPRVCGGAVPVVLHLLSPAQRPIQVTQDLRGFWERTYREVKKELKGRYPKHYWPDDPLAALPTARVRPR